MTANKHHSTSINKAIDFIQQNLSDPIKVQSLSKIAGMSEFHFNRIFKSVTGESVYQFIKRVRLESAASLLLTQPSLSVSEVVQQSGFDNSSSFAKSFKQRFKLTASQWRKLHKNQFDQRSQAVEVHEGNVTIQHGKPTWTYQDYSSLRQVVIKDLPIKRIAYVRNVGSYQGDKNLYETLNKILVQWAVPRGYWCEDVCSLNIYHDNPGITDSHHLRLMVALEVDESARPSGEIGISQTAGGRYGTCRFILNEQQFQSAWGWMHTTWLHNSGYEVDNRESIEICHKVFEENGQTLFDVEICIPVVQKK